MVVRRRLIFWLIKAYIKKWRKTVLAGFLLGIVFFFLIKTTAPFLISKIPVGKRESIGLVGSYTVDRMPPEIVTFISRGLTRVDADGSVKPDLATSWEISADSKTYTFTLNPTLSFTDGSPLTSADITYNFTDTKIQRPDKHTVIFILKDSFAPFLATAVSRPVLKKGYIGVGPYKMQNIKLNGPFLETITLVSAKNRYEEKYFQFYPTVQALKTAYALGEISKAEGLSDVTYTPVSFDRFQNTIVTKRVEYEKLVTLFFNTTDRDFSNEKLRNALSYALPDTFSQGERSYFSYPKSSWAYPTALSERTQDLDHAQSLLTQAQSASGSAELVVTIKTSPKLKKTAEEIQKEWQKINVTTKIEITERIPQEFEVFLGEFTVPKDPDQYLLWHKDVDTNITRYADLRIDKLLEDGRKIVEVEKRKKLYEDFQKYLIADSPAAFLYFPYHYEISRK